MWEQLEQAVSRFWHDFGVHDWTHWSEPIEKDVAMVKMGQLFRYRIDVQTRRCLVCNMLQERRLNEE